MGEKAEKFHEEAQQVVKTRRKWLEEINEERDFVLEPIYNKYFLQTPAKILI